MFYGLSKFIKKLLPQRLFYRSLLIVAVPIIGLQIVISIVFFDSLWIKTNKGMTSFSCIHNFTFTQRSVECVITVFRLFYSKRVPDGPRQGDIKVFEIRIR